MSDAVVTEIETLLAEERAVLTSGDYGALADLATRKEDLFARLPETLRDIAPKRLRVLRASADRNHALLAASARGLRAVQRRLSEIRTATGGLSTYSESGERRTLSRDRGALERRA